MDHHELQRQSEMTPSTPPATPPPEGRDEPPDVEENLTLGQWFVRNGPMLVIVAVLFGWLFMKFDSDGLWAILKAALGLGFVIFIHELGHFLVAKWCDVHVTVFSIGFGPALPGCRFQWGETMYKLALFPLGGYVQMVGQVDADESSDGSEDDPRSYRNKTVWQRMAIISAGVVMNAILAIICFIVVFQGPGKDRQAAVIEAVEAGKPAFEYGIPTGAEILRIGDLERPYFDDLRVIVMGASRGEKITLVYQRPGDDQPTEVKIPPVVDKRPLLGLAPASRAQLAAARHLLGYETPVSINSAAARASPPFEFDDLIVGVTHPEHGDDPKFMELPRDPRKPEQRDYFEYLRRLRLLADKDITIVVERKVRGSAGERTERVGIKVPRANHRTLGVRMKIGAIAQVRKESPAAKAGVRPPTVEKREDGSVKAYEGDRIRWVKVRRPDGSELMWAIEPEKVPQDGVARQLRPLDPVRLPDDLRQWARQVFAAKATPDAKDLTVQLHVKRHGSEVKEDEYKTLSLQWDQAWQFDRAEPNSTPSPLAIPELGLAYQVQMTVADAKAKDHALQPGDEIKDIRFHYQLPKGETEDSVWLSKGIKRDLKAEEFASIFWHLQAPQLYKVTVKVKRGEEIEEVALSPEEDTTWPLEKRGLILAPDQRTELADNFVEAIGLGFRDTWRSMVQVYQNLRGMITGQIALENLGGPVTIARVAYRIAGYDFWEFVFFIGLISINLAVINFLPIPVLDGGHMVFLLYEKIRGKPASEKVRIGATYAGLALILSLMVFVIYLDISRIFRGG